MAKATMADLIKRAQEHEGSGNRDNWSPPEGLRMRVKVVFTNSKIQDNGYPSWGMLCEVLSHDGEGDFVGKSFWVNTRIDPKWDFINKETVLNMEGFGISAEFLAESDHAIVATAVKGVEAMVLAKYGKNKKDPKNPYFNPVVTAVSIEAPPERSNDDDDDDDDWDED